MAKHGWEVAKEKINSGDYHLILLDEITYPVSFGWIDVNEVVEVLRNRPEMLHVVLTGRDAEPELVEVADLVTEMKEIKHPFQKGLKARKGIDF